MNESFDARPGCQARRRWRGSGSEGSVAGGRSRRTRRWLAALSIAGAVLAGLGGSGCGSTAPAQERRSQLPADSSVPTAEPAVLHLRAFATTAAVNRPLPADPALDPRSAAIASALNAGEHNADYLADGTTVFDAAAGDRVSRIVCTDDRRERCPLAGVQVSVNERWKPSPGSDRSMVVIDYPAHKAYDLWHVATGPGGTVALSADSSIRVGWGDMTALGGSGKSPGATGSGLSHLFGMIRVHEAWSAVNDGGCHTRSRCALASAIPHALHVATSATCRSFRSPAVTSDGTGNGSSCVPEGAHLFLDAKANCAFDPAEPIEEAVCFALQRYGAFVTDTGGSRFAVGFEGASAGEPGGSGPSPYKAGGLKWDYYDMSAIPWRYLEVTAH